MLHILLSGISQSQGTIGTREVFKSDGMGSVGMEERYNPKIFPLPLGMYVFSMGRD